ncbi:MAG: DUF134 domain-containing protein [Spirochaetales bacterium]|nr:DUF134 domain-containing protein [Spirochaetales bacterium]
MSPCRKKRCCRNLEGQRGFKPMGIPGIGLPVNYIALDEFEAIRLCDLEGKNQIQAGEVMGVSRGTIQRLLKSGRAKIVEALLKDRIIIIDDPQEDTKNE